MIGRSGDAMCDPHRSCGGDEKHGFPALATNQWWRFVSGLSSKPLWCFLGLDPKTKVDSLSSKPLWRFLGSSITQFLGLGLKTKVNSLSVVWTQNHYDDFLVWASKPRLTGQFGDLGLKITTTVCWFEPQNQVGWCLSVCASKPMGEWRRCEDMHRHPAVCFGVKQVGLRFPSFASKLAEERWHMVHVASSQRPRGRESTTVGSIASDATQLKSDETTLQ
jgi:hypothetical protein